MTTLRKTLFAAGLLPVLPAGAQQLPNIVILMTDQQRADICGRAGFPLDVTPFADEMGAQGAWFSNAYTSAPASVPARTTMATGRFPSATHVRSNHNVRDVYKETDLPAELRDAGYQTALVGKNHCYLTPKDFDFWEEYGHWGKNVLITARDSAFHHFLDQDAKGQYLEPSPFGVEDQSPFREVSTALDWLGQVDRSRPFFLCISMAEPHNPYQVPEPYYSMFPPEKLPKAASSRSDLQLKGSKFEQLARLEDESCRDLQRDLPRLKSNYLGMLRLIDDQQRRLVEGLKEKGLYDTTVFLIIADHGDYFGEYGLIRKGAGVPESLIRIPMVWFGKGIKCSGRLPEYVSIADVFPTLCAVAGRPLPRGVQGRNLLPLLEGRDVPEREFRSIVVEQGFGGEDMADSTRTFEQEGALQKPEGKVAWFDELNSWTQSGARRAVVSDGWKLVLDSYGKGELYDLSADPAELRNLYDDPSFTQRKTSLLEELGMWLIRLQDPLPVPRTRYKFTQHENNYHFIK